MKSATHQNELTKFQNYLRGKKQSCFKEAGLTVEDFKSDNLAGQIYNKEDVEELMDRIAGELEKTYNQEIDRLIGSAGTFVSTALQEAERNGFEINVDVDFLNNKEAMDSLKAATKQIAKKAGDPGYKASMEDLLVEVETLRTKNKKMQEEILRLTKGDKGSDIASKDVGGSVQEVNELRLRLSQAESKIEELSGDMNKKLNESVQFNNLKKMMQQRNEQIKKLRERLGKYENVEDIKMD